MVGEHQSMPRRQIQEILKKIRELEDSEIYLRNHRSPLNADEAHLKIQALNWVLKKTDSL